MMTMKLLQFVAGFIVGAATFHFSLAVYVLLFQLFVVLSMDPYSWSNVTNSLILGLLSLGLPLFVLLRSKRRWPYGAVGMGIGLLIVDIPFYLFVALMPAFINY